ncbi:hypothetical protein QQP08_000014 [Theobroma cacao]|nr:hypothetical protein QQP08_000014 [Theobroma cacao]
MEPESLLLLRLAFHSRSASTSVTPTGAVADLEEAVEAMKWKDEPKTRLRKNRTLNGKGIALRIIDRIFEVTFSDVGSPWNGT